MPAEEFDLVVLFSYLGLGKLSFNYFKFKGNLMVYNNFVCFLPFSSNSITKEPLFFITFGFFNIELQSGLFLGSTYKSNFIISDNSELYLFGIGS